MDISAYQHMNIRMSTRGKRPLRNLTPNDKVRAIQRIHNGETKASVSRDIGVPESTLRGWCKNEQKLRFMCRQLGTDNLGLNGLDSPPEKRAKFELQLLPPKFGTIPNYDDLGFAGLPFPAMDYTNSHNDSSIFEKIALVEFMKRNGMHTEAMQQITDIHGTSTDSTATSAVSGYASNNMVHQLNLLALFNSKLSPKVEHTTGTTAMHNAKIPEDNVSVSETKKYNCPLLSVKNWAKDPAKHVASTAQTPYVNDNNNNDIDAAITTTPTPDSIGQTAAQLPGESISLPHANYGAHANETAAPTTTATDATDCQSGAGGGGAGSGGGNSGNGGAGLLDWCKMFSASLNFFAFAAAAASMQQGVATLPPAPSVLDDVHSFNEALLKRLSPLAHSESSKESYYDSEPEDLSVRSCASKVSSPTNSRSQSPDKTSTSSRSIHSDGEQ